MPSLLTLPPEIADARLAHGVFSDFSHYTTAEDFTTVVSDSGTVATSDAAGGIVTLTPSDGTVADNDEAYLKGTVEQFLFADNKPISFEALVKFTEANTDDANVIVGLMNAVAANSLVDDGGGPPSNYSGVNFHKVDGGTKWIVETSVGATQQTTTTATTAGGSSYQRLRIDVTPISATTAEAVFFIDGEQCKDANGNLIKHRFTYTGATEMQVALGVKNGGANLETLLVDYVACFQKRN